MDCQREIIYLAITNLIKDCIESLEGNPNKELGAEDKELLNYIIIEASKIEVKMAQEMGGEEPHIPSPNWDELK